ncbi:hypothetical protein PSm6_00190 [Pseudomonas solani]|uniref:Uncharacterized protein n=1 Tax=Pseudomonas solani TaxID=2731552 RepID=A0ABM7L271_9PSED|nr:hypothetical protein [Pseudomonas solani]BCD83612.1 hypothetical protein PSm6_00190 [Pseudomonas solani]
MKSIQNLNVTIRDQAERIKELEDSIGRLIMDVTIRRGSMIVMGKELDELRAELDACRSDAKRWRDYLRDPVNNGLKFGEITRGAVIRAVDRLLGGRHG